MKKKQIQEIKNKSADELKKDLIDHRDKIRKLKFDLAQGKVKNSREIGEIKKTIARILTLLNK